MREVPLRVWFWVVISALLQLLPFPIAGPVPLWRRAFCWICLVPLLWVLIAADKRGRALSCRQAMGVTYFCGVLWYLGNCYWIFPTMHIYGALSEPVAAGILVLFALYLGLYFALFGFFVVWVREKISGEAALLLAPIAWVAVELARARITGFPWDLLGYTLVDNLVLNKLAPWTGVMGLSLLVAVVNAAWVAGLIVGRRGLRWASLAVAVLTTIAAVATSGVGPRTQQAATDHAVLVQDNLVVGAEAEPQETRDELLSSLKAWSHRPEGGVVAGTDEVLAAPKPNALHPDVILWPEAPADFIDGDPVFRQGLEELAVNMHSPVIADSVAVEAGDEPGEPPREYNSASFFTANGLYAGRYDKMHLVPFGEYTPYKQLFFFAGHLLDNVGGFTPGTKRTLFVTGGHSYGVFICYESIFGDEIRELSLHGANVLVNLSDDGWYGDSSAPWEHLDMVRMRAIENDRWVLRSTNTGVTTAIDPEGRVGPELPRHVRGALYSPFDFESGTTFYARHGDWIAWICAVVTALMVLWGGVRLKVGGTKTVH